MMLELDGLTHRYDDIVVEDISFGVDDGELVAVLGPSGCGKTTLVQAVAGHLSPTAGRVRLRGEDVTDDPPETRSVGLVFQEPTLFPHMSVRENVAYGLEADGLDDAAVDSRVKEYLSLVALTDYADNGPAELSGGQRRRVELARALATQPELLVLDEPLSALDRQLRTQLQEEIASIQAETGVTTLFVTHDQQEAMALADRLVVMDGGEVSAIGPPRELYESPPNRFVASFLGRSTTLELPVSGRHTPAIELGGRLLRVRTDRSGTTPETVTAHLRPRDLTFGEAETDLALAGTVDSVADRGRRYDVTVDLEGGETVELEQPDGRPSVGEKVRVGCDLDTLSLFDERGQRVEFSTVERSLQSKPELRLG